MTVVRGMEIGREITKTLAQINLCIEEVKAEAQKMDSEAHKLRDANGFVLPPLLAAKAQCLHALTLINQRGK